MPRYRDSLPQLDGRPVLTDGGLETVLVFQEGLDLPHFASFVVLDDEAGRTLLARYLDAYTAIALRHGAGLLLESTTWRASPDWVARVTGAASDTPAVNERAIEFLSSYRDEQPADIPMPISGCVGPRGDGYVPDSGMTADQAAEYHRTQIEALAATDADLISALTLNYVEEAIGVARAAASAGVPSAISFTVETDGRLPTGQPLGDAIQQVDEETDAAPAYYMINCAHPAHFADTLDPSAPWAARLKGLRANASMLSHAELEEATELDEGDPADLGRRMADLRQRLAGLSVVGGCCGTDHRHLAAIADRCFGAP
ncbi:homocysteine S-methyltransferase family protein [Botrimarina sp.]|uniref:homocysteine S-methyltransferase family protein n=1 Tax=Botrimarina sp. TaxID=2795802 RepID=UPI0032EF671A